MAKVKLLKVDQVVDIDAATLKLWQDIRIPMEIIELEKPEKPNVIKEKIIN